jgi:UDPglucose--hexose-1-phosphate uridylyltransferase
MGEGQQTDPQAAPGNQAPVWEQRWHPLREEWVIVAAHRQNRPWSGQSVGVAPRPVPPYDPGCYLCPRNGRISGARNPDYDGVFVFDNDHPCVSPLAPEPAAVPAGSPYRVKPAQGTARVVCYTPRHDLTLAELPAARIAALIAAWQDQVRDLGGREGVDHVLIFENKGEVVGVSNPHPHGQIYATNFVFRTTAVERAAGERHWHETGRVLFQDIIRAERQDGRRILAENEGAIAFVPHFARYAYEVFVAPKATHATVAGLSVTETEDLAAVLKRVLVQFDNLWRLSFPYVMALHQAPTDGATHRGFHFHIELHPPLRKPDLLKYLAGPEIGGGSFLADTSPEAKAAELAAQPPRHYKEDAP